MPETPRGRKGWKQNSNGKPNNWATNSFPSNQRLRNQLIQGEGSSLEATLYSTHRQLKACNRLMTSHV